MRSVADDLRWSARERLQRLSPEERIALAGRLADADLDLFCAAHQMGRDVGRRTVARQRQSGRRASQVMEPWA